MKISEGKRRRLDKTANPKGVIAAIAVDHRDPMRTAIAQERGVPPESIPSEDLTAFKTSSARILSRHASALLLDPEYSLSAVSQVHEGAGVLLAYEKSGYDDTRPGHRPLLLPFWSARRLLEAGADAIKVLLHYTPFEREEINDEKRAFVERVGAECAAVDIPFFLELIGYNAEDGVSPEESAARKPDVVRRSIAEFTQERYGADILKVELPVALANVEGTRAFGGTKIWNRIEALDAYRRVAEASTRPMVYLSGGVTNEVFAEALELAVESGVNWCGVLCGRAIWKEGVPVYCRGGVAALEEWLETRGAENFCMIAHHLEKAYPWHAAL